MEEGQRKDEDENVDDFVNEEMSDDDDGGLETRAERNLEAHEGEQADGGVEEDELPVGTIDAYWLQRELGKFFNDPMVAQKMAEDVLETLVEVTG